MALRSRVLLVVTTATGTALLPACNAPQLAGSGRDAGCPMVDAAATQPLRRAVDLTGNRRFDILFLVDNSNTNVEFGAVMERGVPSLVATFAAAAKRGLTADLHLGVVSSDLGAGATGAPGLQPSWRAGACGGQVPSVLRIACSNTTSSVAVPRKLSMFASANTKVRML